MLLLETKGVLLKITSEKNVYAFKMPVKLAQPFYFAKYDYKHGFNFKMIRK